MNDKIPPSTPLHLDAALSEIATDASRAASDGLTGSAEVHRLIKRSRRQRATAFGSAGFVLLGVAGIGLSGVLSPAPVEILPAPPVPSPTPEVVEPLDGAFAPACGEDLSELRATTTPVALGPATSDVTGETPLQVTNTGDTPLTVASAGRVTVYLLDAEGKVASTHVPADPATDEAPQPLHLAPGESGELGLSAVGPCGDATPPAAGTWSAIGSLAGETTPAGGVAAAGTVVGGPWTVTLDDQGRVTSLDGRTVAVPPAQPATPPEAPEAPETPEPPTHLPGAFGSEKATFPAPTEWEDLQCGSPAPAATGDALLARLKVVGQVPAMGGSSEKSVTARVTTHAHARLDVVDWFFLYEYVISQDGVIVSSPLTATDSYENAELQPGSVQDGRFTLAATASCDPYGTSSPQPLPPGTYQLHATLPWMIDSYALQQTDGAWGRTVQREAGAEALFKGRLVSAPVTFTVQ
ncbi:hypothetical protein ACFRCR_01305 [Oerskovia sp. NPDC056781]|uniref:hypothetical protein n=1 Tax=Oerskovia sp. NPDC056781 TaxID=3345942 RepID=UPI00366BD490